MPWPLFIFELLGPFIASDEIKDILQFRQVNKQMSQQILLVWVKYCNVLVDENFQSCSKSSLLTKYIQKIRYVGWKKELDIDFRIFCNLRDCRIHCRRLTSLLPNSIQSLYYDGEADLSAEQIYPSVTKIEIFLEEKNVIPNLMIFPNLQVCSF